MGGSSLQLENHFGKEWQFLRNASSLHLPNYAEFESFLCLVPKGFETGLIVNISSIGRRTKSELPIQNVQHSSEVPQPNDFQTRPDCFPNFERCRAVFYLPSLRKFWLIPISLWIQPLRPNLMSAKVCLHVSLCSRDFRQGLLFKTQDTKVHVCKSAQIVLRKSLDVASKSKLPQDNDVQK